MEKSLENTGVTAHPKAIFWLFVLVNMAPSLYFFFFQDLSLTGKIIALFFPLGMFVLIFSLPRNPGKLQVLLFPLLVLHAFQIVLFFLFGDDVLAAEMFLNVITTNTSEVRELLGALLPAILTVCVLYIPVTILGIMQWKAGVDLPKHFRWNMIKGAALLLVSTCLLSLFISSPKKGGFSMIHDVYPVNMIYNLGFASHKLYKIKQYPKTSKDFTFDAIREKTSDNRQIVVLIIGETGRADNWQLYGYERPTNPLLSAEENLILYRDALTQSNVTHQSVPIILSGTGAENFKDIYFRKGIFRAFKEAGFTTVCLSNQVKNASFVEYFYKEADVFKGIRVKDTDSGGYTNPHDGELTGLMEEAIRENPGDLFIVLHTYGSHFNYKDRYPEDFRKFTPDLVTKVNKQQKTEMVNAYDNSILYTDYFLTQTINGLKNTGDSVFLLYASDHGEDLYDGEQQRFLHSSPTPSYFQLRIPFFIWTSDLYRKDFFEMAKTSMDNQKHPVSTNVIFHTLLEAAQIQTPYLNKKLSLLNQNYEIGERLFLDDHDNAVPYLDMRLNVEDIINLKKNDIAP